MDSSHVAKIIFLIGILCLSAYFLYADEKIAREKFSQPTPRPITKKKKKKKSNRNLETYSSLAPPPSDNDAAASPAQSLDFAPAHAPVSAPVFAIASPSPSAPSPSAPSPSAPVFAVANAPVSNAHILESSPPPPSALPWSALDPLVDKAPERLAQDSLLQRSQLVPRTPQASCRQNDESCLEKEWRRDKYKDLVLIPGLEWSVPLRRTPLCTVQRPVEPCPLTDQTSLIGTLLDSAMNTDVGSIMPSFEYNRKAKY